MFRLWKDLEQAEQSQNVIKKAITSIKLTKKFQNDFYDYKYKYMLPKLLPSTRRKRKTIVGLMRKKFDVFRGIQVIIVL